MPRFAGDPFQGGCYVYVDYVVLSQNVAENYSDIAYSFGIHFGSFFFNSTNRINNWAAAVGFGSSEYSSPGSLPFPGGAGTNMDYTYYQSTVRLYHDDAGSGVMTTYAQINPSSAGGGGTRSVGPSSFTLPQIPRYPGKPGTPVIGAITSTSVAITFTDGVGGAPIDSRYVGWGTSPVPAQNMYNSVGNSITIGGLLPGTTYYFFALTHNIAGSSPWSDGAPATTLSVPGAPNGLVISDIAQTSVTLTATPPGNNGGATVVGYQIGYGTNATTPDTTILSLPTPQGILVKPIVGLQPATKYYFWVKAQNSVGYSDWSVNTIATTLAGARVNVGGVWKDAVPYVRDGGVWKLARPWSKTLGVWKETI